MTQHVSANTFVLRDRQGKVLVTATLSYCSCKKADRNQFIHLSDRLTARTSVSASISKEAQKEGAKHIGMEWSHLTPS